MVVLSHLKFAQTNLKTVENVLAFHCTCLLEGFPV